MATAWSMVQDLSVLERFGFRICGLLERYRGLEQGALEGIEGA